jgi:hypothetical protein
MWESGTGCRRVSLSPGTCVLGLIPIPVSLARQPELAGVSGSCQRISADLQLLEQRPGVPGRYSLELEAYEWPPNPPRARCPYPALEGSIGGWWLYLTPGREPGAIQSQDEPVIAISLLELSHLCASLMDSIRTSAHQHQHA